MRYRFSEVERLLQGGEKIEITKHKQVIARLLPLRINSASRPDFLARLRTIYGAKRFATTGATLIKRERDRF